ncbi:MAG TPA: hypothetical protein VGL42_02030 [Opitutaceae bacterium]|jgi:hypothetical protein
MKKALLVLAALVPTGMVLASTPIAVDTFGSAASNSGFFNVGTNGTFGENNGWTVTSGNVDVIGHYWQTPPSGLQSVDLDGSSPGAVGTTIDVSVSGDVTVDFFQSANPAGQNPKVIDVTLGASPAQSTSFNYVTMGSSYGDMMWTQESLTFDNVAAGNYLLNFTSEDTGGDAGPALADVSASVVSSVKGVPDAGSSLVLLGAALATLGLAARRRAQTV